MKSSIIFLAVFFHIVFTAVVFGQKYQSGTRLLKGAEVMSATPLQLDYVLETLADTAKITVNLHEGKTHLVLDDGSGKWREWWYYMGKWQVKSNGDAGGGGGATPEGMDGSIQVKDGERLKGSNLSIDNGMIYALNDTSDGVGIIYKDTISFDPSKPPAEMAATVYVNPYGEAIIESTAGNLPNNRYYSSNMRIGSDGIDMSNNGMNALNSIHMDTLETRFNVSDYNGGRSEVKLDADGLFISRHTGSSGILSSMNISDNFDLSIDEGESYYQLHMDPRETYFNFNDNNYGYYKASNLTMNADGAFFINHGEYGHFYYGKNLFPGNMEKNAFFVYANNDSNLYVHRSVTLTSEIDKAFKGRMRNDGSYSAETVGIGFENAVKLRVTPEYDAELISLAALHEKANGTLPEGSITLTEIIQKGQIITSGDEPDIPNDSFAFWVKGNEFWMILDSGGVQKKLQML